VENWSEELTVHQLCHDLLVVDHDIGLLAMHPTLGVLITVAKNGDLIVKHCKLDVTIPLLLHSVQGTDLVFPRIPIRYIFISLSQASLAAQTHQ
jgi:hypothetical protein